MIPPTSRIIHLMGLVVTGDMGPLTFYTSRAHRLVFFARTPADQPITGVQQVMLNRWRCAAHLWRALPTETRRKWEQATRRSSLKITGYNLYVYWHTSKDRATIRTIERRTGLDLL